MKGGEPDQLRIESVHDSESVKIDMKVSKVLYLITLEFIANYLWHVTTHDFILAGRKHVFHGRGDLHVSVCVPLNVKPDICYRN